jgi:hypothetical protein
VAINQADWNAVRAAVASEGEALYRRVVTTTTVFDEAEGLEHEVTQVSYAPVPQEAAAKASFARIEADVERLIQEVQSLQLAERELRTALEEPGGSEFQRR